MRGKMNSTLFVCFISSVQQTTADGCLDQSTQACLTRELVHVCVLR